MDMRDLLASPEYAACKAGWESRAGVKFAPRPEPSVVVEWLAEEFESSGIGVNEVAEVLDDQGFAAFLDQKAALDESEGDVQEYPPGKEPDPGDPDEVTEVHGYVHSAIAGNAIWYLLAKQSQKRLADHLVQQRVPKARAYARELMKLI
ncbi:hypothetical protein ACF1BP_35885 [Streptomyces sp. NPDC014735]|uniref:hypothetical protein n=1 Tax=unclassified Streptomyces TaxID=2593676 RepID=UPI0036FAF579